MPNSNLLGYSTASKQAIALINAEIARKDAENEKKDLLRSMNTFKVHFKRLLLTAN